MKRYLSLYGWFVIQNFKARLEYPASFLIGVISQVFMQAVGILTIWVVMQQVPILKGWNFDEVMLIYGLLTLSAALAIAFAPNLWIIGRYIHSGQFDRFLTRPINPLFHLLANEFFFNVFGELATGIVLITRSLLVLGFSWAPLKVLYLILAVLSGGGIFIATWLITAVAAFWIMDSANSITGLVFQGIEIAQFPLSVFPRAIQILMTWVIPYAFASYYPASYLLGRNVGVMAWAGIGVAIVMLVVGYRWWLFGLRHYASTGS